MGRRAVDPVRRLTLALLLASVAALRASVVDVAGGDDRAATTGSRSPSVVPLRLGIAMVYDQRRCREAGLTP